MGAELDHIFICVSTGGREADALIACGMTEGSPNRHPGQGTACRRFFFANAYLELLWVNDEAEARGAIAGPTHLWERWSGRASGACPFGILLRPDGESDTLPFTAWEYRPPYLPAGLKLHVGENAAKIAEPALLFMPMGRRPDMAPEDTRQPMEHPGGFQKITRVRVMGPWDEAASPEMLDTARTGEVEFAQADRYRVEVGFDGEAQGRRIEIAGLPLVVCT